MRSTEDIVVALMTERRAAASSVRKRAADLLLAATLEGDGPLSVAEIAGREERAPADALIEEMHRLARDLDLNVGDGQADS
jgi:hypothetical protein